MWARVVAQKSTTWIETQQCHERTIDVDGRKSSRTFNVMKWMLNIKKVHTLFYECQIKRDNESQTKFCSEFRRKILSIHVQCCKRLLTIKWRKINNKRKKIKVKHGIWAGAHWVVYICALAGKNEKLSKKILRKLLLSRALSSCSREENISRSQLRLWEDHHLYQQQPSSSF